MRKRLLVLPVATVVVAGAFVAYRLSGGGKTTPVATLEAVKAFRASIGSAPVTTAAAGAAALPSPGVYVYSTSAYDAV